MRYVLDTNFVIKYFRRDPQAVDVLRSLTVPQVSFSIMTYLELVQGEVLAGRTRSSLNLSGFVRPYELLPLSVEAAKYAGREALRLGRGRTHNDMHDLAIGATAREFGRTVLTENVADFAPLSGVRVKNWRDL
ncbi:MAG: type II toxin-antitoxin system VapC family toxin [Pleurocapsa sp. SU_196_0]|nr:type II toxin-antitoxin system VapC family toxin [Pleurocapsa sp. SU_196_0]